MRGRWRASTFLLLLTAAASACDLGELLSVGDPGAITPEDLAGLAGAEALRAGAIGEFALALAGDRGRMPGQILVSGMLADEWVHSGSFDTDEEFDRRLVTETNPTLETLFATLHRARRSLEEAADALAAVTEEDPRVGELRALAGHSYLMFAESWCAGVPYSEIVDGLPVYGEPTTVDESFERAAQRFLRAMDDGGEDAEVAGLAAVGLARARLGQGRFAEAGAAAAAVPTDYRYEIEYSDNTPTQENGVYAFNVVFERWSLADFEAGVGLDYRSSGDPRVPWSRTPADNVGFDLRTPQYDLLRYDGRDAPIPLATGEEARLIEAEAELWAGRVGEALSHVDEVRGRWGLGPVPDPGSDAARLDLLMRERAFTLVATGRRLGDLRRLVAHWGRPTAGVFPSGSYFDGGVYGSATSLPIPARERANPLFRGCLDVGG